MIVITAERSLEITKEACERLEKKEIERIENKLNDLLNFIAKKIYEAAINGKSSIKIAGGSLTDDEDWDDLEWYLSINHYDTWYWYDDMVISWSGKDGKSGKSGKENVNADEE